PQENMNDRTRHGKTANGERCGKGKFDAATVHLANRFRSKGWSYSRIARHFGVSKRQAMRVCKGAAMKFSVTFKDADGPADCIMDAAKEQVAAVVGISKKE